MPGNGEVGCIVHSFIKWAPVLCRTLGRLANRTDTSFILVASKE